MSKPKPKDDEKVEINLFESNLVPKHELLSPEQKKELLDKLNISMKQLPRIKSHDPVVKVVGGKRGDIIKITRKSPIASEYVYYRVVI